MITSAIQPFRNLATIAFSSLLTISASAQVTTLTDEDDSPAGDGISLREAIRDAASGDTITFDPSLSGGTLQLDASFGALRINKNLTIDASDLTNGIIIDGGSNGNNTLNAGETRCLVVDDNNSARRTVTLRGLTIQNGVTSGQGANIQNAENLRLINCQILNGRTQGIGNRFGGIFSDDGSRLTLIDTLLSGNSSGSIGFLSETINSSTPLLRIERSEISNNPDHGIDIRPAPGENFGGPVFISQSLISDNDGRGIDSFGCELTVQASTISNNRAIGTAQDGGGIRFFATAGDIANGFRRMTVSQSTIIGNTATRRGGGIVHVGPNVGGASLTSLISGCTILGNTADKGGGVSNAEIGAGSRLRITNSIIAANSASDQRDVSGDPTARGVNFIGNPSGGSGFRNGTDLSFSNTSSTLSTLVATASGEPFLTDNGGPTPTVQLVNGSPAFNAGVSSESNSNRDQRGTDRRSSRAVDLGAVEFTNVRFVTTLEDELDDVSKEGAGLSLREAIRDIGAEREAEVFFDPRLSGGTIQLRDGEGFGELRIEKSLRISGRDLPDGITISGGSNGDETLDPGEVRCFFISDGDADQQIAVRFDNLTVKNGVVMGEQGGGNFFNRENLTLTNCRVIDGVAIAAEPFPGEDNELIRPGGGGGGISTASGVLILNDSVVSGNRSHGPRGSGGGVHITSGVATFDDVDISANFTTGASASGGGIFHDSTSGPLLLNRCTLSGNRTFGFSSPGGGLHTSGRNSNPTATLTDCLISDNHTAGRASQGGAIFSFQSTLTLTNCTAVGNSTSGENSEGGAIFDRVSDSATSRYTRCTMSGNSATNALGGAYFLLLGSSRFEHCTIVDSGAGGGLGTGGASANIRLAATLVRDHSGGDVVCRNPANTGNFTSEGDNLVGTGNALESFSTEEISTQSIRLRPLGDFGGLTPTRPPLAGSPVINAALSSTSTTDQIGFPIFTIPDIGAVEFQGFVVTTLVDELNTNASSGQGISLREALREADVNRNEIFFDPALDGGTIRLNSARGPLEIDTSLTVAADGLTNGIIIDGRSNGDQNINSNETQCIVVSDGDTDNRIDVILRGLIIQNGVGSGFSNLSNLENLTLENCQILDGRISAGIRSSVIGSLIMRNSRVSGHRITGSNSNSSGGGMSLGGTIEISGSEISDNRVEAGGGGMRTFRAEGTITDTLFRNNRAEGSGGAATINDSTITFRGCTFDGNRTADGDGGAVRVDGISPNAHNTEFIRCTLSENRSDTGRSGAINIQQSSGLIEHCTIVENVAGEGLAGGVTASFSSRVTVRFSIIRDNSGGDVNRRGSGSLIASGNIVGTGDSLQSFRRGQQNTDPILLSPLANYGGLTETRPPLSDSPALDAAEDSTSTADQRGFAIVRTPDIGAAELQSKREGPFSDLDQDGLTRILELALGTDPDLADFDAEGRPKIGLDENGDIALTFGRGSEPFPVTVLIVERSTSLQEGSFEEIFRFRFDTESNTPKSGIQVDVQAGEFTVTDTQEAPQAFYRFHAIPIN